MLEGKLTRLRALRAVNDREGCLARLNLCAVKDLQKYQVPTDRFAFDRFLWLEHQ